MKELLVEFSDISPLSWQGIAVVIFCATIIGLERQLSGKPAGIRTSILICMGTYIFSALAATAVNENGDYTRVIGQIVTGVGFLGAGVMLTRDGLIVGVTSASVIWLLAGVGCLIGLGFEKPASLISMMAVFILVSVSWVERKFSNLKSGVHKNNSSDKE